MRRFSECGLVGRVKRALVAVAVRAARVQR